MQNIEANINNKNIEKLATMFSYLGDPTRLQIVILLMQKDACVSEIAEELQMTQSAISHQLRILKAAQILKNSKNGRKVIYSIKDDHVMTIIHEGLNHMAH